MCFQVLVSIKDLDEARTREIARLATIPEGLSVKQEDIGPIRRWWCRLTQRRLIPRLEIFPDDCGCALLKEDVDFDTASGIMRQNVLNPLAITISKIAAVTQSGFSLEAHWQGEKPSRTQEESLDRLLQIIRDNELNKTVKYTVRL